MSEERGTFHLVKKLGGLEVMEGILKGTYKFEITKQPYSPLQLFWKDLYQKYLNLDIDPSIIEEREGKWAIFVAKGMTAQQVFDALPFNKWNVTNTHFDIAIHVNDRIPEKDYVIYVDQNIEADEQLKDKSANDLKEINHTGITLLERLLLELYYFEDTGEHLDVKNVTLCTGSRDSDGSVPSVDWRCDELKVSWYEVSDSSDSFRSRLVVSA